MKGIMRVLSFVVVVCLGCGGQSLSAMAQAKNEAPLPPALQAAVASGNSQAVSQAIATLSGGNPARAMALSENVIHAAERLLTTNPQAAVAAAAAALSSSRTAAPANPAGNQDVITTAARIFVAPNAQRVAPDASVALATSVIAAASAANNPSLTANVSASAVNLAERTLATNPTAAVTLAGASVNAVKSQQVLSSSPAQSLDVVTTAARIIVTPAAQASNATLCGQMAQSVAAVATDKGVYAVSPAGALKAMANSYATANTAAVKAADPGAAGGIVTTLNQAAGSIALNQANPANGGDIARILANPITFLATPPTPQTGTPVNGPQPVVSPS